MKLIDVHCHIDQYSDDELEAIFQKDHNLYVIGAAMNKTSGDRLLELKERYNNLDICLGIHPEDLAFYEEFKVVKQQILNNQETIIAIGEIGLPYYSLVSKSIDEKNQVLNDAVNLLKKFIKLGKLIDKPVILHAIEETADVALSLLKEYQIKSALFHWFEGSQVALKTIVDSGYYISVSPEIMYNFKYAQFVSTIPLSNMVLESDGPWEYNGQKGVPNMTHDIAKYLSTSRSIELEEVMQVVYKNTCRLFNKEF